MSATPLTRRFLPLAFAAAASLLFASCGKPVDPDLPVFAVATRPLTEVEVATLPNGSSLAELEQRFGRGEPQSANRLAYLADKKNPGKYFWVYPYDTPSGTMIHHIVLADRMEENGQVIWPAKWRDMSPASAAYILDKMQRP